MFLTIQTWRQHFNWMSHGLCSASPQIVIDQYYSKSITYTHLQVSIPWIFTCLHRVYKWSQYKSTSLMKKGGCDKRVWLILKLHLKTVKWWLTLFFLNWCDFSWCRFICFLQFHLTKFSSLVNSVVILIKCKG